MVKDNSFKYKNLTNICNLSKEMVIELCGIRIDSSQGSLIVLSIYRPPYNNIDELISIFSNVFQLAVSYKSDKIIICTDCNIDYIKD